MSDSPALEQTDPVAAVLRQWIANAEAGAAAPSEKRRYAVLIYDGARCVTELREALQMVEEADASYALADTWLTPAEFEALEEFHGF